jgi:molybdopterin converting factor small subunit
VIEVARVSFTSNLRRHVECPAEDADGATVREVLDSYFERHPAVRSYVLDEQGGVRRHVAVFVGGTSLDDVTGQSDPVDADTEVVVMQALSGGC